MKDSYHIKNDAGDIAAMAFLTPDLNMETKDRWILNRIAVARGISKGEGWGTRLLTLIVQQADAEKVTLWLGVDPDDPRMFSRLVKWYRRHGFTASRVTRTHNVMVRRPT